MTTTAQDRDINKPHPCSRQTRWRPFWRCWQTVSISTYFVLFKTVNWHFFFVCRKLHYLGCIRNVFFCRFLSGSVELANSKQKKHQLPSPRFPNCSEYIFELTIWCIKAILFPIISFLLKILPVCLNLLTDLGYSHYPSFWRNLIHTLFPKEIVWDFKENTTKQANRNM